MTCFEALLLGCFRRCKTKCPPCVGVDDVVDNTAAQPIAEVTINCAWACCQSQAVEETVPAAAAAESDNSEEEALRMLYDNDSYWQWHHHNCSPLHLPPHRRRSC